MGNGKSRAPEQKAIGAGPRGHLDPDSYGCDEVDAHRRTVVFADTILKGAGRPQPAKVRAGHQLKTAKALGFTVPPPANPRRRGQNSPIGGRSIRIVLPLATRPRRRLVR
jgi:hypothetical protein